METDLNQPVVIDNGSGVLKAGFAGAEAPKLVFPAIVGRPRHTRVMAGGAAEGDFFVGRRAEELRGILRLSYPSSHGVCGDWDDMQRLWEETYSGLNVEQSEHPVLLTAPPLNPRNNLAKSAEVFFERFNVPAFYSQMQAILALYASGRTTGLVLDSGDGVTHSVPVYEGFSIPSAINRVDVGGRDVTNYLGTLLRKAGSTFHTSAEMEVVRAIKESVCYVAFNVDKLHGESLAGDDENKQPYKLPDGRVIHLGPERYRAPEVLFNPAMLGLEYQGIHECVVSSINRSDLDIRRRLFSEIVLAGGSTLFTGFGDRLLSEVRKLAPRDTKVRIYAPAERTLSTWVGGSILASLTTFRKLWISRQQYQEYGENIIWRKTI